MAKPKLLTLSPTAAAAAPHVGVFTVEERIVALHHQKRDLALQLLSGTERSAKLSVADMLALLETPAV